MESTNEGGTRTQIRRAGITAVLSVVLIGFGLSTPDLEWRLVDQSLDLTRPNGVTVSFEGREDVNYRLGIEVRRTAAAACLLRLRRPSTAPPCPDQETLDVSWHVVVGGDTLDSGSTDTQAVGSRSSRGVQAAMLASLPPRSAAATYTIGLQIREAAPALAALDPRLVVDIGPAESKEGPLMRAAALLAGIACSVLALALVLQHLYERGRAP